MYFASKNNFFSSDSQRGNTGTTKIAQPHFYSYQNIGIYPESPRTAAGDIVSPSKVPHSFTNPIISGAEYHEAKDTLETHRLQHQVEYLESALQSMKQNSKLDTGGDMGDFGNSANTRSATSFRNHQHSSSGQLDDGNYIRHSRNKDGEVFASTERLKGYSSKNSPIDDTYNDSFVEYVQTIEE